MSSQLQSFTLSVNGQTHTIEADPAQPMLWAIREQLALTGTKFGCGIAQCGACTVQLNGQPVRSCVTPVSAAAGAEITTVEGLATAGGALHPLQQAWIDEQVPQCGYCQSGQLMSAAALLAKNPNPTDEDINQAMQGNVCRCGMYNRIRRAIHKAAGHSVGYKAEPGVRADSAAVVGYFDPAGQHPATQNEGELQHG